MKPGKLLWLFLCLTSAAFGWSPPGSEVFFPGTDQQLEVIRIKGGKPGPTVLIFGGIHGDEPGGYFSSEILSKTKLLKGNLIIVPRVNFPSIMLNRREVNGDMNRKFVPGDNPKDPDTPVIKILKKLMAEADIFINQHDAVGFHRETYISSLANPSRYGQSIIIDCSEFFSRKLAKKINLAQIGAQVMERVNRQIKNKDHHFGFWDHNSVAKDTRFPEMRNSATYYALTTYSIPAFGVETSKDLPTLYDKVKYQLLAIKEILLEFGVEAIFPMPTVPLPYLYWVEFLKNGTDVIRVNSGTNFRLNPGDRIQIKAIYANYATGLSADILSWGTINDLNKEYTFTKDTEIHVKKNHLIMGTIHLRQYRGDSVHEIAVNVDGSICKIPNWGIIELGQAQSFKIIGTSPTQKDILFDVRGFSPGKGSAGDAGIEINVAGLQKKFSFLEKGHIYFVKIFAADQLAGGFQVQIK